MNNTVTVLSVVSMVLGVGVMSLFGKDPGFPISFLGLALLCGGWFLFLVSVTGGLDAVF